MLSIFMIGIPIVNLLYQLFFEHVEKCAHCGHSAATSGHFLRSHSLVTTTDISGFFLISQLFPWTACRPVLNQRWKIFYHPSGFLSTIPF